MENSKCECGKPIPSGVNMSEVQGEPYMVKEFRSCLGGLSYIAHWSRPDIIHCTSVLASFRTEPTHQHWDYIIYVLSYLRATTNRGITYGDTAAQIPNQLYAFADADYASDVNTRRSRSGYVVMLNGGAVSWKSHLQDKVSQSTTEAEYYALAECFNEIKWSRGLLSEISYNQKCVTIYEDNTSAINLANNPISHPNTKQIEIRHHLVRNGVQLKEIKVTKIPTIDQAADVLTKNLDIHKFKNLTNKFMDIYE